LKVSEDDVKRTIFQHPEFVDYTKEMDSLFGRWRKKSTHYLKELDAGLKPRQVILELSESLLAQYRRAKLVDRYDVYQHLMDYWDGVMQDDCYLIATDGWKAETYRITVVNKKGKEADKGWTCDLIPKKLMVGRYFSEEKQAIEALEAENEAIASQLSELEEEHRGEDGVLADMEKVNKGNVQKRLKEIKDDADAKEEAEVLKAYLDLLVMQGATKKKAKKANADLDAKLYAKYPTLTEDEVKSLVVDDKWMSSAERAIQTEMDRISQGVSQRIAELADRYETPLPRQTDEVKSREKKVLSHLEKMGYVWD